MRLFRLRDPHEPDGTDETKKAEEYSWKYDKKESKDFFAAHGSRLWIVGQIVRPVKGAEEQEAGYEKAPGNRFFASLSVAAGKNAGCCDSCTNHRGEQHTRDVARAVFVRDHKNTTGSKTTSSRISAAVRKTGTTVRR